MKPLIPIEYSSISQETRKLKAEKAEETRKLNEEKAEQARKLNEEKAELIHRGWKSSIGPEQTWDDLKIINKNTKHPFILPSKKRDTRLFMSLRHKIRDLEDKLLEVTKGDS
jgi:hypothetical protein